MSTKNLFFDNQNFEIDFLLLVPKVGLVLLEVKYYSGEVSCTDDRVWKQKNSRGVSVEHKNASLQVLRTRALLKKLLAAHNGCKWPIKSVVVFVHPKAVIFKAMQPNKPQTEVLTLNMLECWIDSLPKKNDIIFKQSDSNHIRSILTSAYREYQHTA